MLVPLCTSGTPIPVQHFWNAIFIYHDRPHIVNRKLTGATLLYFYEIDYNDVSNKLAEIINYTSLTYETKKIQKFQRESLGNLVLDLLKPYDKNVKINEISEDEVKKRTEGTFISIQVLHPSHSKSDNCVALTLFDKGRNSVLFVVGADYDRYLFVAPPFAYTFECTTSGHVKLIINLDDASSRSAEWLAEKLFPKLIKWSEEYDDLQLKNASLSLVSIERYSQLYKELKEKYGKRMVEIWPESTDPRKFVYEDVAIATYLMCIWEETHPQEKPSFVDLGCGNGLLVYILSEEGYPGFGIDVRKRKIWDLYPNNVKLEIKTIIPSESSLFPNTDWIIGNHSDELTPWIPVIAARSSNKTNFFVLPCCSYDFNGSKYIRINPNKSQYSEYLEYVEQISQKCGFSSKIDKLRIPSTKRTCLVSFNRSIQSNTTDSEITELIHNKCGSDTNGKNWVKDFQPRSENESVRNCTKLDRNLINKIVLKVMNELLKLGANSGNKWNAGGKMAFVELIKAIDKDDLKKLKNECGGVQTLLKNHRYIFEVCEGNVKLRVPPLYVDVQKYKSKPCWFLRNHPDGCLNTALTCAYEH